MEEVDIRSLNGLRVSEYLKYLASSLNENDEDEEKDDSKEEPSSSSLTAFQEALKFLKYWAQHRGIYSSILGFLSGVSIAILLLKVMEKRKEKKKEVSSATSLILDVFSLYGMWDWTKPVLLTSLPFTSSSDNNDRSEETRLESLSWQASLYSSSSSPSPFSIITPLTPTMNTVYGVGKPQKEVIVSEMRRGKEIVERWKKEKKEEEEFNLFSKLCSSSSFPSFLSSYSHYISITITSPSPLAHKSWLNLVLVKVRSLVSKIDFKYGHMLRVVPTSHIHTTTTNSTTNTNSTVSSILIGLLFFSSLLEDISDSIHEFLTAVNGEGLALPTSTGMNIPPFQFQRVVGMDVDVNILEQHQINPSSSSSDEKRRRQVYSSSSDQEQQQQQQQRGRRRTNYANHAKRGGFYSEEEPSRK